MEETRLDSTSTYLYGESQEQLEFPTCMTAYEVLLLLDSPQNLNIEETAKSNHDPRELAKALQLGLNNQDQIYSTVCSARDYLNHFIRLNFTGPSPLKSSDLLAQPSGVDSDWREKWVLDGEGIVENIEGEYLVYEAEKRMDTAATQAPSLFWWKIRAYFLHQQCLEEKSTILWNSMKKSMETFDLFLKNPSTVIEPEVLAVYYTELSQIYSYYYDIERAKGFLSQAKELVQISASATGIMGKRTRHQQTELAQLVLKVDYTGSELLEATKWKNLLDFCDFPQAVVLEDEDRLDRINITDDSEGSKLLSGKDLTEIQHVVLFAEYNLKRKYLPHDGIYREELSAYLNFLTENPKVWAVQLMALAQRSVLELDNRRTVERSMKQLELLRKAVEGSDLHTSKVIDRLKYFYSTGVWMKWEIDVALSQVLSSLNLHKEALDISLRLQRWEDVISCYSNLNLRHKAEEVIRDQLAQGETVKLWILLGDATDNVEFYERAWNLSKMRSARAQRQWGYHYFVRKNYADAIPHLRLSVELNPLENPTWIRLGFAALSVEDWPLSTKAYQHSSTLDADNFEVWNNMGHGFTKLKDKPRALRAFKEASKCNYESWQVWDNTMVVAVDCKAFDDVIRSYNRLLDLKGKWTDPEVLSVLVRAVVTNIPDSSGLSCRDRYMKETLKLFGRITSVVTNSPKIWQLYGDLVTEGDDQSLKNRSTKGVGYCQRSVESILQDSSWSKVDSKLEDAVEFCLYYTDRVHDFVETFPDTLTHADSLTRAQFTVKRIYSGVKKTRDVAIDQGKYDEYLTKLKAAAVRISLDLQL